MAVIATIRGTAIVPGVSRNGRLYTRQLLAASVAQAQERIAAGDAPMTMLTHHGAEDDSTRIVGRLTALEQDDTGRVTFAADIADTAHGRDLAALVTGTDPFLNGVSIRGWWDGPVRTVDYEGQQVQTGDRLVLDGLDFTKTPGVPDARVEPGATAAESAGGRVLVYESVADVTARPAAARRPATGGPYADPGYHDGVKRLPIDTREHAERAWRHVQAAESDYTAAQLKRVRGRIKKALHRYGAEMTETTTTRLGDVTEYWGDRDTAGFCIDAYNGSLSLSLRSYGVEPAELRIVAQKAMDAAVNALQALDPEVDDAEADDDQMESVLLPPAGEALTGATNRGALAQTTPASKAGATTTPQEVPAVSEQPTTPAAAETATTTPAAPVFQLTKEQFDLLLAQRAPAAETAPAEPAAAPATAPAPVAETEDERIARLVTAGISTAMETLKSELRAEAQAAGPQRRGFVVKTETTEADMPKDKALHELPAGQREQLVRDANLRRFGYAQQ